MSRGLMEVSTPSPAVKGHTKSGGSPKVTVSASLLRHFSTVATSVSWADLPSDPLSQQRGSPCWEPPLHFGQ